MATLRLQHLDAAARCADGSVPAYYLREGPSDVSLGKIGGKNWVNIKTWVECNELYFSPIVSVEHDRTKQQSMNPWGFVPSKHWGFASIFPHRIQVFDLAAGRGRLQH